MYITTSLAPKGVQWKFNSPAAPLHGGMWERLVRSVKRTFYAIFGNEVLSTNLCLPRTANLEQSPLTTAKSDVTDLNPIIPNFFLLGDHSSHIPSFSNELDFDHRKIYALAQFYADAIWSRWST